MKAFVFDKGCATFDEAETIARKTEQLHTITSSTKSTAIATVNAGERIVPQKQHSSEPHPRKSVPQCALCDRVGHDVNDCWLLQRARNTIRDGSEKRSTRGRSRQNSGSFNGQNRNIQHTHRPTIVHRTTVHTVLQWNPSTPRTRVV